MSPDPHGSSSSTIVNGSAIHVASANSDETAKNGATSSSLRTYIFMTVLPSIVGSDMVMLKYSISPASLNATDMSGIVSISSSSSISSWSWSWSWSSSIAFIAAINVSSSSLVSSPSLLESDSSNTVRASSSSSSSGPSSAFSNSSKEMLLLLSVSNKHSASSGVMLSSSIFSIPTS